MLLLHARTSRAICIFSISTFARFCAGHFFIFPLVSDQWQTRDQTKVRYAGSVSKKLRAQFRPVVRS